MSKIVEDKNAIQVFTKHVKDRHCTVVDIGGADGECGFLTHLRQAGYTNVHEVDIDPVDYQPSYVCDISTAPLPFDDNSVDVITCWQTMEHLENPHHFTREVYRVLKKDGLFIFSVPNIYHIISRLLFLKRGEFPRWTPRNNHIWLYSKSIINKMMARFRFVRNHFYCGELTYLFFKRWDGKYPENQWFAHFITYVYRK